MLPSSLLQVVELLLPLSLYAGAALGQGSSFNIKAHNTGYRVAAAGQLNADNIGVSTSDGLSYTVDIVLGGLSLTVLLDTGSTDLWVYTGSNNIQIANATDLATGEAYGQGQVEGTIAFTQLQIGDFVIESQAFLDATQVSDFSLSGVNGIMGMSFDVGSIYSAIQQAYGTDAADQYGRAPITELFAQNASLPNNFDVQLGRTTELNDISEGTFTISSHAPGFENVTSAPQLQRVAPDHWSIVMDSMLVNGQNFTFNQSRIAGVPSGKVVAALDTGFSFPPLPPAAVDAIYGSIPGAAFDNAAGSWIVPCTEGTNLSFVFAGQEFPVHPLDLTYPIVATVPVSGTTQNITVCANTYQYLTLDPNDFTGFDVILGDAFLRNVYASFDYGDYYPTNRTNGLPFVQMISTTNKATMWNEFQTERAATLAQLPPTVDPSVVVQYDSSTADSTQNAASKNVAVAGAVASDGSTTTDDSWGNKFGMIALGLLGANLLVGIVLLGVTLTMCVRGVKGKSGGSRYTPVRFKDAVDPDYERGHLKYSD